MLPGVGRRTAERYAYTLAETSPQKLAELGRDITSLPQMLSHCQRCGRLSEKKSCEICTDSQRNRSLLCIVATSRDIISMERTGKFIGTYFVLGGVINPLDGVGPESLRFKELQTLVVNENINELLLAFNSDINGEATILYIKKVLGNATTSITTLARGIASGTTLEYADPDTLAEAIGNRLKI